MRTRLLIGAAGVLMVAFGALRFLQLEPAKLLDAVLWMAGGVVVHDAVLAPLTIAFTLLAARVVPPRARGRVAVAVVVLLTVTATAIPVLGRFGARPDNVTLLDRNYTAGWLVLAALVLLGAVVAGILDRRRRLSRSRG